MSPGIPADPTRTRDAAFTDSISLDDALSTAPHSFLQPSTELHQATLKVAKRYLDPLAKSVSECQLARLQDARRKRKRNEREDFLTRDILRLKQLHLDGFSVDQVWEQARRVIDATQKEAERVVRRAESAARTSGQLRRVAPNTTTLRKNVRFEQEESESDGPEMLAEESGIEGSTENRHPEPMEGVEDENLDEDIALEDIEDDSEESERDGNNDERRENYTKDPNGLNDGFFLIDEFNRQTEFLERQDAKGDPDDGAASDEEEVDWSVDPANAPLSKVLEPANRDDEEEHSEDDHDPALGSLGHADLDAPFSDDENGDDEDMDLELDTDENPLANTNDIFYKDFFKPPPQPPSKRSRRPLPKTQPSDNPEPEDIFADMERTMSAVKRDIFEDDDEDLEASDAEEGRNLSSHERRQAALAAQIRQLESEAVAKREWAMSGEARATDRPLNSLLEEDLEFERTGKPVEVVTAEVSSSIEELIKQRILARQFDEVTKRLPGSADLHQPKQRRGLVDIDERGPDQSLAAIYEAEHLQRTDPNYVDPRDKKLKAAHAEIEKLWSDVSAKLDALSNWHYRPKPPAVEVSVVSDAPRIAMEDARPSGVGVAAEQSGLAPQEVYKAGAARERGEVVTKAGTLLGKGELSREEKQRHFRREQERERKKKVEEAARADTKEASRGPAQGKKGEKVSSRRDLAENLKRGGVKVIGKGGEIVDVEGKKVKGKTSGNAGGSYKL